MLFIGSKGKSMENTKKYSSESDFNVLNKYFDSFERCRYKSLTKFLNSKQSPITYRILHVGVGGFHRSHQAYTIHEYNKLNLDQWEIVGIGLCSWDEHMFKTLKEQNFNYTLVSRCNNFSKVENISVIKNFHFLPSWKEDEFFFPTIVESCVPIISMTITEKGYYFNENHVLDRDHENIKYDLSHWRKGDGISVPKTIYGFLSTYFCQLEKKRMNPVTVLSCDNLIGNGNLCRRLCIEFLSLCEPLLIPYVETKICFPNSMVDRITPFTTNTDKFMLQINYNIVDKIPVMCENYISWVIEEKYSSIVPRWKEIPHVVETFDIEPFENKKLLLLNSSHSFIWYLGYLYDVKYVFEFMMNETLVSVLENYMNEVTQNLDETFDRSLILDYREIVLLRFQNFFIKDELSRLAQDGSMKLKMCLSEVLFTFYKKDSTTAPYYICLFLALFLVYMNPNNPKINDPNPELAVDLFQFRSVKEIKNCLSLLFPPFIKEWNILHETVHNLFVFLLEKRYDELLFPSK